MSKEQLESNMDSRICNPARHRKAGETCLSLEALERIKQVWNKTHANAPIRGQTRKANSVSRRISLWKEIRQAMKNYYDCDTEYCVVKKVPGLDKKEKDTLAKRYFRPEKPEEWNKKKTTWLDSFNIEDVMNQYEDAYDDFEFIGPVPMDFDSPANTGQFFGDSMGKCIVDELCKLDVRKAERKGTERIGIIFNLDDHDEPGSHWVCAFVDYPKKSAYYFDSYGLPPSPEITRFLERCKAQGCETVLYNDIQHQRKDSECGMYCLYVIICLLKGRTFQAICTDIVKDDTMNAFRDVLFASEKPRREALNKAVQKMCA
jgi:Ulp1 protease family, C-terminal catalytic domain